MRLSRSFSRSYRSSEDFAAVTANSPYTNETGGEFATAHAQTSETFTQKSSELRFSAFQSKDPAFVFSPGVSEISGDADNKASERFYLAAKRIFDIVGATVALSVFSPVYVVVALLVWAEDNGPVLYRHNRVGQNGKEFSFYKFRSMVPNADAVKAKLMSQNEAGGPVFKMRNDPRITHIGRVLRRYSLDELPQLWNVLKGDMSLVGPRPHLPGEVARYEAEQWARLSVQPGLICLREVSGRSNLCFERWMETDLDYVRRRSFILDLQILARVIPAVFKADGAY